MLAIFLIIFYIKLYQTLTTQEIEFICHFNGIRGFPVNCSDAMNACNYSGIGCDSNGFIIELSLTICGGDDIIP
jgi:hypothetical protein